MNTPADIEMKFWKSFKSDRTVMLGIAGSEDTHTRAMTAQMDGDEGPIWFFGSKQSALAKGLGESGGESATMVFTAKDHDLFASVHSTLLIEKDHDMVERLWNPFVAAWYTGKDDPKLLLMGLDAGEEHVWLDGSSLIAGIKMMLGVDPKEHYKDKVAKVDLS